MSDATILYAGIVCFSLTLVGLLLTALEFRRMNASRRVQQRP